jgi:hypothetical protein
MGVDDLKVQAPPLEIQNAPMSESGLLIDPVTGEPELPGTEKEVLSTDEKEKYAKVFRDTQQLLADLQGDGGIIYGYVTSLLADRINKLVQIDPRCLALLDVLSKVKRLLNVGNIFATNYARISNTPFVAPTPVGIPTGKN